MSTTTTNYGLVKPELTDAADITAMNANWDKIDSELKNSSESDVFIATYETTTSAEIEAAYQAGKAVYVKKGLILGELRKRNSATSHFFHILSNDTYQDIYCISGEWSNNSYNYTPASHASTHASGGSDPITPESIGAANKPTISTSTMLASRWSNGTYSFENSYPVANYDIEIALDSTATINQAEAFNGAQIVGSATNNIAKAYGIVPTIDIPIIVKVVVK